MAAVVPICDMAADDSSDARTKSPILFRNPNSISATSFAVDEDQFGRTNAPEEFLWGPL